MFIPLDSSDQTDGNCSTLGCRNGNLVVRPESSDIKEEDKLCKACEGVELTNQDKPCDDGLFCTSFDVVNPGPDHCIDGTCKATVTEEVKSPFSASESFDFGEAERFIAKAKNISSVISTIEGHVGQRSGGTGIGGESAGSFYPTVSVSVREVQHCCESEKNYSF